MEFGLFQDQYASKVGLSLEEQPTETHRLRAQSIINDFEKLGLWGIPYAKVEAKAYDNNAARRNALREIRACIEILNFYSDLIPYTKGFIYLPGEAEHARIITPMVTVEEDSKNSYLFDSPGPLMDFPIKDLLKLEAEQGVGFSKVQVLINKNRNEYEERLLTAIRWAGKATVLAYHDRKEDAFLLYMIALKSVIVPENAPEITYRMSLRLAHLLASGAEYRPGLAKKVRELYGIRSSIVHSGSFEIKDSDLATIRLFTKNCIVHLLRDEPFNTINSTDDLLNWFDTKIFG